MILHKGDKILMKKIEDLPEEVRKDKENVETFSKFAGKICTVSDVLNKNPLFVELEEDEELKGDKVFKSVLISGVLGFDSPMTKRCHFSEVYIEKKITEDTENEAEDEHTHSFGWALRKLKKGLKVARKGWNGKGLWLELQRPDAHSKMTLPYIYMNYPKGDKYHDGCRVPWLASQTDMLEEDWFEVE